MLEIPPNKTIILINCISVKVRAGGVFQIAQNFIRSIYNDSRFDWYYLLSQDLANVLDDLLNIIPKEKVFIFPTQPDFLGTYLKVRKEVKRIEDVINAKLVYTIASPSYFQFRTPEVMRFANAWFVNVNKYALGRLSLVNRIKKKIISFGIHYLLRKSKYFITQTETSKNGLSRVVKCPPENIKVVPNVLPDVYKKYQPKSKTQISIKKEINILYVAAPHPNKRIELIPKVLKQLVDTNPQKQIKLHLTLPPNKNLFTFEQSIWQLSLQNNIKNHGYCNQDQLAQLYLNADIVFFPSVLETFSLSLIEAAYFNVPIVASNFSFNKDILSDAAVYFEPDNDNNAATLINELINNPTLYLKLYQKIKELKEKRAIFFNYGLCVQEIFDFFDYIIKKNQFTSRRFRM